MFSGLDWFPTLLAAAGDATVKDRLLKGWAPAAGGTTFKVHLDGYNQLPYLTGQQPKSARNDFYYFDDDGLLVAMRFDNWKVVFCEQRAAGGFQVWQDPFTCFGFRRSSTYGWTPSNVRTSYPTSTTIGS